MDELLAQLAPMLGYIVAAVIIYLLGQLGIKIKKDGLDVGPVKDKALFQGGVQRLHWACMLAVKDLLQTTVGELKEKASDNKLTKEDAVNIKNEAVDKAKSYLGTKGLKLVLKSIKIKDKEIDKVIGSTIEEIINDMK